MSVFFSVSKVVKEKESRQISHGNNEVRECLSRGLKNPKSGFFHNQDFLLVLTTEIREMARG